MNRIHRLFSFTVLSIALAVAPLGCATKDRPLAPGGVYQGDNALYNADKAIAEAYDVMNSFVTFEYTNREALASNPDVRKAADKVRTEGKRTLQSATALRDAYASAPTTENRTRLNDAIFLLRGALTQANQYLAKGIQSK